MFCDQYISTYLNSKLTVRQNASLNSFIYILSLFIKLLNEVIFTVVAAAAFITLCACLKGGIPLHMVFTNFSFKKSQTRPFESSVIVKPHLDCFTEAVSAN